MKGNIALLALQITCRVLRWNNVRWQALTRTRKTIFGGVRSIRTMSSSGLIAWWLNFWVEDIEHVWLLLHHWCCQDMSVDAFCNFFSQLLVRTPIVGVAKIACWCSFRLGFFQRREDCVCRILQAIICKFSLANIHSPCQSQLIAMKSLHRSKSSWSNMLQSCGNPSMVCRGLQITCKHGVMDLGFLYLFWMSVRT